MDDESKYKPSNDSILQPEHLERAASRDVEKQKVATQGGHERRNSKWGNKDDPFGDEEGAEIKYRTMRWWQAAASELTWWNVNGTPGLSSSSHDRGNNFPRNSVLAFCPGPCWDGTWNRFDPGTWRSGYVYWLCV